LKFECVGRSLFWLFVCVFVASLFCLDGKMVDFGDDCCFILASFAPGIDVDGALSSWKRVSRFETKRKHLFLVIFGTTR
jgi:hypothetical protein